MREDVKWTNLSQRQISRRLKDWGTPAGKNVVSRLLWEHGYRRRKPQKKRTMGQRADRNAQFERIAFDESLPKWNYPAIPDGH